MTGEYVVVRRDFSEHWIQFWYSLGNSVNYWGTGHEGDWEHITMKLNSSNSAPTYIEYSYHKVKCELSWAAAPKSNDNRLVVLLAKGSHGSYPEGGDTYTKPGTTSADIIGKGTYWNSRENLVPLSDFDWYQYKGSWGDRWQELDSGHSNDQEKYDFGPSSPGGWRGSPVFNGDVAGDVNDPVCTF